MPRRPAAHAEEMRERMDEMEERRGDDEEY